MAKISGVWFPRNVSINILIYTWGKKVKSWIFKHNWKFWKKVSAQFQIKNFVEVSRKTVWLSILHSRNVCSIFVHSVHIFCDVYWPIVLLQFHYKALIWLPLHYLHKISLLSFHILLWHVYSFFALQYVCTAMNFAFSSSTSMRFISSVF